jgi:membrane associated rhomboid family serine protease
LIPFKDNIPTDNFPVVTVALIVANAVAYLVAISHGGSFFGGPTEHELTRYGAVPYALTHGQARYGIPAWETVITSMFMQASFLHLAVNMLFLWIFGNTVEDSMGPIKFMAFYVAGGIAALALQVAINPSSHDPTVGAAGAIAAVLGGYVVVYPRARAVTLVLIPFFSTVAELPAVFWLGVWFAVQAVFAAAGLTSPTGGGGVAYLGEIGGFAFGALTIRLLATERKAIAA